MESHHTALIVEDEVFVVLDVEDALETLGVVVSASLSTNAAALDWLETNQPDLAIIDYRLKDGTSERVAEKLNSLSIPFLVHSGNGFDPETVGPALHDKVWLDKPTSDADLQIAIRGLIRSRSHRSTGLIAVDR